MVCTNAPQRYVYRYIACLVIYGDVNTSKETRSYVEGSAQAVRHKNGQAAVRKFVSRHYDIS